MISSRMALTGVLLIDLTGHTLEEKWTPLAYFYVYQLLISSNYQLLFEEETGVPGNDHLP